MRYPALLLLLAFAAPLPALAIDQALHDELMGMQVEDQKARKARDLEAMRVVDEKNTARLKEIIAKGGWPLTSQVGPDAASAAWVVAQHSDRDRAFQEQALKLLEAAVQKGEAFPPHYAYLFDRVHQPQSFGTQGKCVAPGRWEPLEIENAAEVDARRQAMGIYPPTLEEYRKMASQMCR